MEGSIAYGLGSYHSRSLCSVAGTKDRNRWWVGTLSTTKPNHLHLLDFDEEQNEITHCVYKLDQECWNISSHINQANILGICSREVKNNQYIKSASICKASAVEEESITTSNGDLETMSLLDSSLSITSSFWDQSNENRILAVSSTSLTIFDINASENESPSSHITTITTENVIEKAAWYPHSATQIGVASGNTVQEYDTRTSKPTTYITNDSYIRDIDYNPNKMRTLATADEFGVVRIYDTRNCSKLLEMRDHSHWVTCVRFNRFHDELLLSSGSDCYVNLESIVSVSSNIASSEEEEEEERAFSKPVDGLVAQYDQHEDSVYDIAWSNSDPWIFASLCYDGRLMINRVPTSHKYKIIL